MNTKGFSQLVEAIADMMEGPSNTNSTGITLHRTQGWRPTFTPYDIETDHEIAVVYKEQLSEWNTGDHYFDAYLSAEWIRENVVLWICEAQDQLDEHGIKNAGLTPAEIEAHLA